MVDPYVDLEAGEDAPSRAQHVILKRPQASWAQSTASVPYNDKIVPNREYPYEGLSVIIGGENWKFLDALALAAQVDGRHIELQPRGVRASPWTYTYYYGGDGLRVSCQYYLLQHGGEGVAAIVQYRVSAPAVLRVEPLVDIRHMYDSSDPGAHVVASDEGDLTITRDDKMLIIGSTGVARDRMRPAHWWYKLGSGGREPTPSGPRFRGEEKHPISPGVISLPTRDTTTLRIAAAPTTSRAQVLLELADGYEENLEAEVESIGGQIRRVPSSDPRVVFRALGAYRFGVQVDNRLYHEAGDLWFRTPWFRDEFEGLLHNMRTLLLQPWGPNLVKDILLGGFRLRGPDGRLPNRIPERAGEPMDYNSADSTLLAVLAAERFLDERWDMEVARDTVRHVHQALEAFQRNSPVRVDGGPVLQNDGLIGVPSWHSWTDGMRQINDRRAPIRVPPGWEEEFIHEGRVEELYLPRWLLPEVNAQWIRALQAGRSLAEQLGLTREEVELGRAYRRARRAYRSVFWNDEDGFLYNLVYRAQDTRRDPVAGSPAVVAMSLLKDTGLFSGEDLRRFTGVVHDRLLVRKEGLAFGIVVRDSGEDVFYGDPEYHEAVVWPRDTPYLLSLVDGETRGELLESNLRHQMQEGFVFYNAELFSPGDGVIPVKNPVQWWSQWTDPYL